MSTSDTDRDFVHDYQLTDKLAAFSAEKIRSTLFRVTRLNGDPTVFSTAGGRWSPPPTGRLVVQALYTSYEGDCAMAEVASYLDELTPRPTKPVVLHQLAITASRAMRLTEADLADLGVDMSTFHERAYPPWRPGPMARTQEIGAAANFLGFDGLVVPSARWAAENVVLLGENHSLDETLEPLSKQEIDWIAWLDANRGKLRAS